MCRYCGENTSHILCLECSKLECKLCGGLYASPFPVCKQCQDKLAFLNALKEYMKAKKHYAIEQRYQVFLPDCDKISVPKLNLKES